MQYNCRNANHDKARLLFDSLDLAHYLIIAVQEPFFRRRQGDTYCPRNYTLTYEAGPDTRVCFMVSREIDATRWSRKQCSPDVAALHLRGGEHELTIVNVYNPRGRRNANMEIQAWKQIDKALQDATGEIILLGDFNCHHPQWGGPAVATEPEAE